MTWSWTCSIEDSETLIPCGSNEFRIEHDPDLDDEPNIEKFHVVCVKCGAWQRLKVEIQDD